MLGRVADQTAKSALAPSTREAYRHDVVMFEAWCQRSGLAAFPLDAEVVRLWVADLSMQVAADGGFRYTPASIDRFLAALSRENYDRGFGRGAARHPRVSELMSGLRRERTAKPHRAAPLVTEDVRRIIGSMSMNSWPAGVSAARDRLALLLGYAAALRVSSVAALHTRDVTRSDEGIMVFLRTSKTDQYGLGTKIGVPFAADPLMCAACALSHWRRVMAAENRSEAMRVVRQFDNHCHSHGIGAGLPRPLFVSLTRSGTVHRGRAMSDSALREMIKRRLSAAGYDPEPYSFHSLRAGFVTQARRNGASARDIRLQTGHSSDAMVDVYDREYHPFSEHNAVNTLGL